MTESVHVACPACSTVNRLPPAKLAAQGKCGKCGALLFQGRPVPLDATAFAAHAERSDLPLLIDFWAAWCGPCRAMAPVFEQAAATLEPGMRLGKVDTEAAPAIAERFGIRSIPTLVLVRRGREIGRVSGAMPLDRLLAWTRQQVAA